VPKAQASGGLALGHLGPALSGTPTNLDGILSDGIKYDS